MGRREGSLGALLLLSSAPRRQVTILFFPLFALLFLQQCLISIISVNNQEAELAKEKMHGKLISGRPLTVRVANEKSLVETAETSPQRVGTSNKSSLTGRSSGQMSRSAKIAAIKNKLKEMEEESSDAKRQKLADTVPCSNGLDRSSTGNKQE